MRSPTVRGALQSVLGTDYVMHACRAFHNSDGRDSDQAFHKVSRPAKDAFAHPAALAHQRTPRNRMGSKGTGRCGTTAPAGR